MDHSLVRRFPLKTLWFGPRWLLGLAVARVEVRCPAPYSGRGKNTFTSF